MRYNKERVDAGAMRGIDLIRVADRARPAASGSGGLQSEKRRLSRIELFRQIGRTPDPDISLSDSLDSVAPFKAESLAVVLAARADVAAARESCDRS